MKFLNRSQFLSIHLHPIYRDLMLAVAGGMIGALGIVSLLLMMYSKL